MKKSEHKRLGRILGSRDPLAGVIAWWKEQAPKRKPISQRELEKKAKQLSGKGARAEVRAVCMQRSGDHCECGCGRLLLGGESTPELDHFFGRAKSESVETCWMLARACHRSKTENWPHPAFWDGLFAAHCKRHGYPVRYRREAAGRSPLKPSKIIARSTP